MAATVPVAAGTVNRSGVMAGLQNIQTGGAPNASGAMIQAPSATTM
jgi:hypothetical protein